MKFYLLLLLALIAFQGSALLSYSQKPVIITDTNNVQWASSYVKAVPVFTTHQIDSLKTIVFNSIVLNSDAEYTKSIIKDKYFFYFNKAERLRVVVQIVFGKNWRKSRKYFKPWRKSIYYHVHTSNISTYFFDFETGTFVSEKIYPS